VIKSRVEKKLAELKGEGAAAARHRVWNGERYALSDRPSVTLKVSGASALKDLANPDLATLGEAYVEGRIDVEGPIDEALRTAEALSRYLGNAKDGKRPVLERAFEKARFEGRPLPLRRLERFLRTVARPAPGVLVRILQDRRRKPGEGAEAEARPHLPQAAVIAGRALPGHRLRLGCARDTRCRALRGPRDRNHTIREPARARERAHPRRRLQDRCEVRLQDYRDVPGEGGFDKIASVGMFEHVGTEEPAGLLRRDPPPAGAGGNRNEPRHHVDRP
jgi:cyclopropane-fatty-acyl-phospholipid synthase